MAPTILPTNHVVDVGGTSVFYRQAGDSTRPTLLLLHGFPSSSHMFDALIPRLSEHFHLVAPDLPGFGLTRTPEGFSHTFAALAEVMGGFVEAIGLERFALYVFDYGAPVGLRLALAKPERVAALISQNGNAYEEGLSEGWNPIRAYWRDRSPENREALRTLLQPDSVRSQYEDGADAAKVMPHGWLLDAALLSRPGQADIQLDLFGDYGANVALYPDFQRFLRERRVPVLAAWGRNDPFFLPAGAEAFRRDVPDAEVRFYDTGHFALETHAAEIADAIVEVILPRLAAAPR